MTEAIYPVFHTPTWRARGFTFISFDLEIIRTSKIAPIAFKTQITCELTRNLGSKSVEI
jgi:hypothetical protein